MLGVSQNLFLLDDTLLKGGGVLACLISLLLSLILLLIISL